MFGSEFLFVNGLLDDGLNDSISFWFTRPSKLLYWFAAASRDRSLGLS